MEELRIVIIEALCQGYSNNRGFRVYKNKPVVTIFRNKHYSLTVDLTHEHWFDVKAKWNYSVSQKMHGSWIARRDEFSFNPSAGAMNKYEKYDSLQEMIRDIYSYIDETMQNALVAAVVFDIDNEEWDLDYYKDILVKRDFFENEVIELDTEDTYSQRVKDLVLEETGFEMR